MVQYFPHLHTNGGTERTDNLAKVSRHLDSPVLSHWLQATTFRCVQLLLLAEKSLEGQLALSVGMRGDAGCAGDRAHYQKKKTIQ